jgi:ribosomal protein S18 acetylase RimI-like enzyme
VIVDGQPVGQLRVDRRPDAIHVVDVSLLPQARGRGIGTRVITTLLDEARAAGLAVTLAVFEHSRARGLYERLGFAETGSEGAQVTMRWPT